MFLLVIFLVEWFLKCLNKCFRDFFFRGRFLFRVFVKFVKYLFEICDIFLLSLIILLFSWRMIVLPVLLLLENRGFTDFHNFLVSVILLEFDLLKYCCFAIYLIYYAISTLSWFLFLVYLSWKGYYYTWFFLLFIRSKKI